MDSLIDHLKRADGFARPPRHLGILYAEDFDEAAPGEPVPTLPEGLGDPPNLTAEDMERACAAAVEAARSQWEAGDQHRRIDLLASISASLASAQEAANNVALATAEGVASTLLAMLSGALPRLCRDYGTAEVRGLVQDLLPTLRSEPRVTIRVHADLVAVIQRDVDTLGPELVGAVLVLPAPLSPGDVKITWENGSLARNSGQILSAMGEALSRLGLHEPVEVVEQRSMALAE